MRNNMKKILFSLLVFTMMITTVNAYEKNIDLSITSVTSRVDSGETANFIVDLKTTGSNRNMKDVDIRIDLPKDFELNTKLEDLSLMGQVPTKENDQLKYHFSELRTGISKRIVIGFKTRNGYDLNNERVLLKYSLSTEGTEILNDQAEVRINASGSISTAKELLDVDGGGPYKPAKSNSELTWQLRVSANKNNSAQLFLKEGSKIVVTDTLPKEINYIKDTHNGKYDANSHSITWTFDAPSYSKQETIEEYLFLETIQVETAVKEIESSSYFLKLVNKLNASAELLDGTIVNDNTFATMVLSEDSNKVPSEVGSHYRGGFRGPANDKGAIGTLDNPDPFPDVYETATLAFRHRYYIHPGRNTDLIVNGKRVSDDGRFSTVKDLNLDLETISKNGYQWIKNDYTIDPSLIMKKITLDIPVYAYTSEVARESIPVYELPIGTLVLKDTNGNIVEHHIDYRELSDKLLTLDISDLFSKKYKDPNAVVTEMSLLLRPNENQDVIDGRIAFPHLTTAYYNIKPGTEGEVSNQVKSTFQLDKSKHIVTYEGKDLKSPIGPRHAKILPKPEGTLPIAETTIKLEKDFNGVVLPGENTLELVFRNTDGSLDRITGNYEIFVRMTKGVDIDFNQAQVSSPYKLLQAEPIKSMEEEELYKLTLSGLKLGLLPADKLEIKVPVTISESTSSSINMSIYAHSSTKSLEVPEYPTKIPTNTVIVSDEDDLSKWELLEKDHNYIKSENHYSMIKREEIHSKKSVKGDLDDSFSDFGHVTAGGDVAYRLELDHTVDSSLKDMVIIDVLPSIGDLGITDNEARGSQFSLELEGPIELNDRMKDKFDIYYTTTAHPKRDDLSAVANNKLTNPKDSVTPKWLSEKDVSDWSAIKSFKIHLKPGLRWRSDEKLIIDFMMKAPIELDDDLITLSKDDEFKYEKAAWNSFAVAVPNLHVVEPVKVGVALIDDVEVQKPTVDKYVNVNGESYKDIEVDSNQNISYLIEVDLPKSINAYENLVITDKLHEDLELVNVKLNGKPIENDDLESNHIHIELSRTELFELKRQGKDSIELEIITKIKKISLDENLEPIPIPNTVEVIINNEMTVKPEKPTHVKPKVEYGTLVAVVTEGENAILEQDTIDDFSEKKLIGSSVIVKSYDGNPFEIDFSTTTDTTNLIHRLPVGKYILQQDTVIDGYIKTEESIVVEIKANELTVVEVFNPKQPTPAEFVSSKSVSVNTGESYATGGDVLTYGISIENIGETAGTVRVMDTLEFIEEFVFIDENQEIIINNIEPENVYTVKDLMSGIDFHLPGKTQVQLLFTVKLKDNFDETSFELINKAQVNDDEVKAQITVKSPRIEIMKTVEDENMNEIAEANESLSYKIVVSNTGDYIAEEVLISDSMINLKEYVDLPDMVKVRQGDSSIEMDIEMLQAGFVRDIDIDEPLIIEYDVIVKEGLAEGQALVNTAFANEEESTETIKHHKPLLEILKVVKDENEDGLAESNERLIYEISVRNIGLIDAKDVHVIDTLEMILPYIKDPSNEEVYHNGSVIATIAELQEGITISDLKPGEQFKVSFGVQLLETIEDSLDELVNIAYVNDVPTSVEIPVRHPKIDKPTEPKPVEPVTPDPETPIDPIPEEPTQPKPKDPVIPKPENPWEKPPVKPEIEEPSALKVEKPKEVEQVESILAPDTGVVRDVKVFYLLLIVSFLLLFLLNRKTY